MNWHLDCERLRRWVYGSRTSAGVGLKAAAEAAGLTPGHLSLVLNGHRSDVRVSTLSKLSKAMDVPAGDLLTTWPPKLYRRTPRKA